ncbi:hypothetical protein BGZ70_009161 [Mortierella alpina]|uniref:Uncharacterized protein n=1 Tax=Mortierella alpina TaxID=64518 RepID=A0A9P6M0Z2_MORAP|nr:hypothetical protein BGZ70_009161 [Mortierella alpina]
MNPAVGDERNQYPAVGCLGDTSSPAPFSDAVQGNPQRLAQGDASVPQNPLSQCQDGAAFSANGATFYSKEMVIDSDSFLYFGLEQGLFYGGHVPPAQLLPNDACVLPQQYQLQPSAPMPMFHFDDSHLLQPLKALPDFSALTQETAGLQYQPQDPAMQLKSSFQLPPESLQLYKNVFAETMSLDFSKGYNPSLERLSSPDDSVSTGSDQGYFDIMSEDGYTYLPDSSYSPAMTAFGTERDFLTKPFDQLGLPVMPEGLASSPAATPAPGLRGSGPHLVHGSFSHPLYTSTSASHTPSLPALSSPLKQQLTGYMSDDSNDSEDESKPKRKKRVRKAMAIKTPAKPKGLKPVLRCEFPGCKITCSSVPSLARHFETHKWRGKYSPVRCEACQNPLSNEFSVQRHIMRSPVTTLCRRMRVYSIMRSATDVEATVRFYPKRGHGKKTKIIDLDMVKEKYL